MGRGSGGLRQVVQVPGLHILSVNLCGLLGKGKDDWCLWETRMKCDGDGAFAKQESTNCMIGRR